MKKIILLTAIAMTLSAPAHAEEPAPKYIAWLMVMWPNGDVTQPYVPISAYKDYDVCMGTIPKMAISLKFPKGREGRLH